MKGISFLVMLAVSGSALAGYECQNNLGESLTVQLGRTQTAKVIFKTQEKTHELNGSYKMSGDALYKSLKMNLFDDETQTASLAISEQTIVSSPTRGGVCTRRFCPDLLQADTNMITAKLDYQGGLIYFNCSK